MMTLDVRPLVEMSVLEPLEHSDPDVAPVRGDCSLIKMTVLGLLEHSGLGVTDKVARMSRLLLMAPSANLGRCPRRPSCRRYWWTMEGRCRHLNFAGMLLPAVPDSPVGIWGTLSSSDSDPAGQDGLHVTGGPVSHLGTLSPSTSESGILVGCSPRPTLLR